MKRLLRRKENINCNVEVNKTYNVELNAITKGNMSKKDIDLRTKYVGKCIYKTKDIIVFYNGRYNVAETVNTFNIDWKAVEI